MISMAKRLARHFPLILLLMFSFVAIVSSKGEQSQQQQRQWPEAAVSEVPQSNATKSPTTSQVGSSEEVEDSSERDDGNDEDSAGEEDDEDDAGGEEDGEDSDKDEGSLVEDDEYADELRAAAGKANAAAETTAKAATRMGTDKEVSELYRRRKKTVDEGNAPKDKRVPSVKKELSSQKEIFIGENKTRLQLDRPVHGDALDDVPRLPDELSKNKLQEKQSEEGPEEKKERYGETLATAPQYATLRAKDALKKLSKRQNSLLSDLKTYLLDERLKLQQLGDQEGSVTEILLKLLSKLAENPQRWERVHQLLTDIRADMDYSREAIEAQKRLSQVAKPLTPRVPTSAPKPTRKPKKKKKKKKPRQRITTTNVDSLISTTVMPWHTTLSPAAAKWRLVAEKLLRPSWSTEDSGDDEVAKLRSSAPSKSRTMHRPLDDKQLENLKALNSERQALMLKAAREYSKPRTVHYGKVRTHQQSSSSEDLSSEYNSNERSHHFGKLISPPSSTSSRNDNYPPSATYSKEQPDLTPHREYPPAERDFSSGRANSAYRWPGSRTGWNWRPVAQPWLPWDTEREYYARLEQQEQEEALKAWQQAQHRQRLQNWNRHRENLPPWLEEEELHRMMVASELWTKPDQTRPQGTPREQSEDVWGNSHNNNSELKSEDQSKSDDSKESPKLTMKTWNSLTSDPATWPFKLPGAKPWPKDENGKSYNPNAELVRKLGLYNNGRPRPDKDALKDLKQQKMQSNDKTPSKLNSWMEPDEQQTAWFNNMKLHAGFDDSSPHWNNENLSSSSSLSNNEHTWPREKIPEEWNPTKTASNSWPTKWKQFAYHKVTAQPTSDKPNKNAFIAVSAVSAPKYENEWRKNDIEEIGQANGSGSEDPDLPMNQMRMNMWKKSAEPNAIGAHSGPAKVDVLESQLESLKQEPVLLEVNVSIKNSTSYERTESSTTSPNSKDIAATNK